MPGNSSVQPKFQAPYALSLIVCDTVIYDRDTQKPTLVGCFSSIGAIQFPAIQPSMTVFAEVADGRGDCPISFRLVDVDEENVFFSAATILPEGDPLIVKQMTFRIPMVLFPLAGEYRFQLSAGDELLMERRIVLFQIGGQSNEPEQPSDGGKAE